MSDEIEIEVLEDGRIRAVTDTISTPNHVTADAFMKWMATQTGAQPQVVKRAKKHSHSSHTHKHEH